MRLNAKLFFVAVFGAMVMAMPSSGWALHLGDLTAGHPEGGAGPRLAEDIRQTLHNLGDSVTGFDNPNFVAGTASTTEVCAFCHTPHGANTGAPGAAPLWNRQVPASAGYTLYDSPNFDTPGGNQPVGVSLACLSCHDGTIAVDALVNMPGSGGFQTLTPASADLLGTTAFIAATGEMAGGTRTDLGNPNYGTITGGGAPFPNLTINLSDDHPISMEMQTLAGLDPQFDSIVIVDDGNISKISRAGAAAPQDKRDAIRLYGANGAATNAANKQDWVECASCHNPHAPRPLFLRLPISTNVAAGLTSGGGATTVGTVLGIANTTLIADDPNAGSAICLSCHEK